VLTGPDLAGPAAGEWAGALRPLAAVLPGTLSLNRGWNADWEQARVDAALAADRAHLSVRLFGGEVLIGPYWVPGAEGGCAGCAELRSRVVADHPLAADPLRPVSRPAMRWIGSVSAGSGRAVLRDRSGERAARGYVHR
jgi:ribosomal protein S12 methylthiotransferase accessory factor